MKNSPPLASVLESLEPKLAPAGVISILYNSGTNSLTINGSAGNDDFIMTHTAGDTWAFSSTNNDTQFIVNGTAQGTSINNLPVTTTTKINLGDGDDKLTLTAAAAPGAELVILEGLFEVLGGKGADQVAIHDELNPVFNGLTKFDLGDGYDSLQFEGMATFANKTLLSAGAGGADITIGPFGTQTFAKGLTVDLGSGGGRLFTSDVDVSGGKLEIKSTGGAFTQIYMEGGLRVDQAVSMNLGSVSNGVTLGYFNPADVVIGGPLSIVTSGGADGVNVVGSLKISGAMTVDMKDGTNQFTLSAGATIQAASVMLKGGKSGLGVNFENNAALATSASFTIDVKANTLAGNLFDLADANALKIGTTFNYLGGATNDVLDFGTNTDLDIRGGMIVSLGAGANGVNFNNADLDVGGNLTVTGLTGADTVNAGSADLNILGSILMNLGAGTNGFGLGGGNAFVGGSLSYTGGAGNDSIGLTGTLLRVGQSLVIAAGDGDNQMQLHHGFSELSSISYTGGKGQDSVYLGTNFSGDPAACYLTGTLTAKLGAGLNQLTLVDSTVMGAVNVQSVSLATEADSLTLRDTRLFGTFTAALGKGVSTLTLDDSTFNSAVNINTGDGNDSLLFDTLATNSGPNYDGANRWNSSIKILSGAGVDQFIFGTGNGVPAATNTNIFRNFSGIFDSGTGADTVQQNGSKGLNGNPFEVTVI